jgi:hypothetical protein
VRCLVEASIDSDQSPKPSAPRGCSSHHQELVMPTETVITLAAIVAAFTIFGVVLAWAERQTHKPR